MDTVLSVCSVVGFVLFLMGAVGSVFSYKNAEWEKDSTDPSK
jgi:hypothetical protein